MASIGEVVSQSGKQYRLFTTVSDAKRYIETHDVGKYDYKPVTVYGVFLKKRRTSRR